MKKNKGFTLIELLAVLVILVVIAAIATPIVMGIINDAKESAARSSADGFIDSVESTLAVEMLTNVAFVPKGTWEIGDDGELTNGELSIQVEINGTYPTDGSITFDENGALDDTVEDGTVVIYSDFTVTYSNGSVDSGPTTTTE